MTDAPRVTIAGGGLSGLTAALRLAQRGYQVTVYEQKDMLGGNLGSRPGPDGVDLDIYPHMYLNWYDNFWSLLADASVRRTTAFAQIESVKQLDQGEYPRFTGLTDMYSAWHTFQNLFSGVGPVADMFVFGYASIDLLAERLNPTVHLKQMTVSGFLNARPYMTKRAAAAFDSFITRVWAIRSYLASAHDFRTYLRFALADPTPAMWLARGSAQQIVISPLAAALREAGVTIATQVQVTGVSCARGSVSEIALQDCHYDQQDHTWVQTPGTARTEAVDELVLAVPAATLSQLVRTAASPGDTTIVQEAPAIAGISSLRAVQIPIMYLYFDRKWPQIPPEPVGLYDSQHSLAFTDISGTWQGTPEFIDHTVLSVSASDTSALPGTGPDDDAQAILVELAKFLNFDPGKAWGTAAGIDWTRTRYDPNLDALLFVNEAGSDAMRPDASSEHISNLYIAGDFANNHVGMATIESAVTSGLQAAAALVTRRGLGAPVEILRPDATLLADMLYVWLRYAWAPYVWSAWAWSYGTDLVRRALRPDPRIGPIKPHRGGGLRWLD
jgi:uncharacterized protein with NAD-binding domain and iron-sulfur cluster